MNQKKSNVDVKTLNNLNKQSFETLNNFFFD